MIEFKEICSTKVARDFQILLVADIERHFSEAALKICVPLLKNARSSNGCGDASAPAGAGAVGPETARAYILKQLWRVRVLLENAFLFRTRKLLKPDWAAKWAWQCLVEQCLPSALKLFKTGNLQVGYIVCPGEFVKDLIHDVVF